MLGNPRLKAVLPLRTHGPKRGRMKKRGVRSSGVGKAVDGGDQAGGMITKVEPRLIGERVGKEQRATRAQQERVADKVPGVARPRGQERTGPEEEAGLVGRAGVARKDMRRAGGKVEDALGVAERRIGRDRANVAGEIAAGDGKEEVTRDGPRKATEVIGSTRAKIPRPDGMGRRIGNPVNIVVCEYPSAAFRLCI